MSTHTFAVDFGESFGPLFDKHTKILGGKLVAVQFNDALAELQRVKEQRDELLEVARMVEDNIVLSESYVGLAASAAIAKATGKSE